MLVASGVADKYVVLCGGYYDIDTGLAQWWDVGGGAELD
jgi:hypothetical protein